MSRSQSGRVDDARRARIILGLAGAQTLAAVSRSQACSVNTVKLWRDRFLEERISGLWGRHPGKAVAPGTEHLEARILDWTLHRKPADGSTHWSSRKLASALRISHMRVARVSVCRAPKQCSPMDLEFTQTAPDRALLAEPAKVFRPKRKKGLRPAFWKPNLAIWMDLLPKGRAKP